MVLLVHPLLALDPASAAISRRVRGSPGVRSQRQYVSSTSRVFPLPLEPHPPSSRVPRSRREQQRHRHKCLLVTIFNTVLIALNALALGSAVHQPTATSSCFSSSVSSLQASILRSVFARVRTFASDVRRRASDSSVSVGLCDSLFRCVLALLSFTSPLHISTQPSLVVTVDPSGWEAGGASATPFSLSQLTSGKHSLFSDFGSYLRDSAARDRAVPIIAHRIALPAESLRPVDLVSALPPDLAALYGAPSSALLLSTPRPIRRRPHVFGSHTEYVRLVRRLMAVGMISLTSSPLVVNGLFAVPKDVSEDRFIIDAVFANAHFVQPAKARLPDPSVLARLSVPAGARLFVTKSDLSNYYHHLALPSWLRPYFCLVGIPAADLGLPGDGLVYPMCHTVPMGWSHSVVVAQATHEHTLYSSGALRRERSLLSLLSASTDGTIKLSGDDTAHGIYIDDLFSLSLVEDRANAELDASLAAYSVRGLVAKPSKVKRATSSGVTVLGLLIDGIRLTVSVSPEDRVDLLRSVLRLLSQPTVTGHELSSVVGSLTWCMLVRRPALQCLHRAYRFALVRRSRPSQLWPTAVRELLISAAMLPLLSASLSAQPADRLIATDACEFGGAVVARPLPLPVPLPSAFTDGGWSTIIQHRWRWTGEHINALEMRAILLGLLWLVSCRVVDRRVSFFTDSMVCLGALNKGRTSAPTLSRVLSTVAALCLSAGIVLLPAHVPTELNPADGPSRFRPAAVPSEPAPPPDPPNNNHHE